MIDLAKQTKQEKEEASQWPGGPAAVAIGDRNLPQDSRGFDAVRLSRSDPLMARFSRMNGFAYFTEEESVRLFEQKINEALGKHPFQRLTDLWTSTNFHGPFGGATLQAPRLLWGLVLVPDSSGKLWTSANRGIRYFEIQCSTGASPAEAAQAVEKTINDFLKKNPDKDVTALNYQDEYSGFTHHGYRCAVTVGWEKKRRYMHP